MWLLKGWTTRKHDRHTLTNIHCFHKHFHKRLHLESGGGQEQISPVLQEKTVEGHLQSAPKHTLPGAQPWSTHLIHNTSFNYMLCYILLYKSEQNYMFVRVQCWIGDKNLAEAETHLSAGGVRTCSPLSYIPRATRKRTKPFRYYSNEKIIITHKY